MSASYTADLKAHYCHNGWPHNALWYQFFRL